MALVNYGIGGLISLGTVFGIVVSGGVIELRSGGGDRHGGGDDAIVHLVSGDSGVGQKINQKTNQKIGQKRQKIKINLVIERPEDLQVKEGDRVLSGQILAEQTHAQRDLETQRQQLQLSLKELALPLPELLPLPPPDFSREEANVAAAQGAIANLQQAPQPQPRFVDPTLSAALDGDVREATWQRATQQRQAQGELNRAIAQLQAAKNQYAEQQTQHHLAQQRHHQTRQQQQIQLAQVREQLAAVQRQLDGLGRVRSPYSGKVQRLRLLGQDGQKLKIEILLVAEPSHETQSQAQ